VSDVTGFSPGWMLANATDAQLEQASLAVAAGVAITPRPLIELVGDPDALLDDLQRGQPPLNGIEQVLAVPLELLHSALHQAAEGRGLRVRPRLRKRTITLAVFIAAPDLPIGDLPDLDLQPAPRKRESPAANARGAGRPTISPSPISV
jgi:hypothetical protein